MRIQKEQYDVIVAKLDFILDGLRYGQERFVKKNAEFEAWRDKALAKEHVHFERIEQAQGVLCERLDAMQADLRMVLSKVASLQGQALLAQFQQGKSKAGQKRGKK